MLDDFGVDSVARGARPDGESDRVTLIRDLLDLNEDGALMSNNTLNKALRIMGCDTGRGGSHCAHGFRATASTRSTRRARSAAMWRKPNSPTARKKRRGRRDEVVRATLARATKTISAASIIVRPIGPTACV
jgi:hypothetical protein